MYETHLLLPLKKSKDLDEEFQPFWLQNQKKNKNLSVSDFIGALFKKSRFVRRCPSAFLKITSILYHENLQRWETLLDATRFRWTYFPAPTVEWDVFGFQSSTNYYKASTTIKPDTFKHQASISWHFVIFSKNGSSLWQKISIRGANY